ncbi:uncharacterized protein LOC129717092 [Wyeomyia smithii]|uniref:uncharacterized protein LOC129717092 n=1 Tax=Wyeomyia smithii TaxID=174621 RepID=UPI002467E81E|nr:uncharacterized protein LOC129717092 [Wyeomyia smithii]
MENEADTRHLELRRTALLSSLERAGQFITTYQDERDQLEVPLRLENLDTIWRELDELQAALEATEESSEGMSQNNEIRAKFEGQYFRIKAGLISKLPSDIPDTSASQPSPPMVSSSLKGLKLPTITLPEFDGDYKEWLVFHDTFHALIHANQDVPAIQKFHYLKSAVTGEAAQVIESFAICAASYPLAWQALVSRYANEYLLKKRHLHAMMEIQRVRKETASTLHGIVDVFERHTKILRQLGEPVDAWSTILEHLLCVRLPDESLKEWEVHASTIENPSYSALIEFLHRRIRVLESISVNHEQAVPQIATFSHVSASRNISQSKPVNKTAIENSTNKCYACEQRHPLIKCAKFERMNAADRLSLVNAMRLCLNCFRSDHFSRNCASKYTCRFCRRRHHSLLHAGFDNNVDHTRPERLPECSKKPDRASINLSLATKQDPSTSVLSAASCSKTSEPGSTPPPNETEKNVFMLTAVVVVVDRYGREHLARALLDCASQPNLITERMAQLLRLKRNKTNILVQGVGNQSQRARESIQVKVGSRKEGFAMTAEFLILQKITPELPLHNVMVDQWQIPSNLFLADPQFHKRAPIDMILGIEHFFSFFKTANRIQLPKPLPMLIDSVFGWIVTGSINIINFSEQNSPCSIVAVSLFTLEDSIERFWKIEELQMRSDYSLEEKQCEELFSSTTERTPNGRYIVRQPRRSKFDELVGDSKSMARQRFNLLERRLELNPELKEEYHTFMAEYLSLEHMRLVRGDDRQPPKACYLPHHPVVKETSTTTKVRVVFDASAKTSTGSSLNEALLVGPVVQDDLLSIILRFRTFPVALVGDIAKMYRQILLHPDDTPYQRILWRFNSMEPVETYELMTVTYGLAPSSFLATRTLKQLAADEGNAYPLGKAALQKSFYVDDFIGGAESVAEAIQLRTELSELLAKGGFPLRKWTSNQLSVLKGLSSEEIGTQSSIKFDTNETVKALGISWEPESDQFRFDSEIRRRNGPATKRSILSEISQLFDPLGLISPITIKGKMLMQRLWLLPCAWDDEVPAEIAAYWNDFTAQLPKIANFRVGRYALIPNASIQLHTYSDASESAYGACMYVRCINAVGQISVQLLASKTRVAPLKRVTLPRLELCAAQVAARLYARVVGALQITTTKSYFWSDSTVTLQWLRSPPNTCKNYVANRVSEIQDLTHRAFWNHVAGTENPADLLSRGMHVDDFLKSNSWKHGPKWLSCPENEWPNTRLCDYPVEGKERRKTFVAVVRTKPSQINPIFTRFSSFNRLLRTFACVLRFIANIRCKTRTQPSMVHCTPQSAVLRVEHILSAERKLIQLAQADAFQPEVKDLRTNKIVSKQSPIRLLTPFLDPEGIIRVGGRLRLSDQPFLSKHPALLPSNHPLSHLIAKSYHLSLIHGGGRLTLAAMREKYWPLHGRRLVRSVIRSCYQCARAEPQSATQQIGQLPLHRITPSRPFSVSGIDYAGPLYLKPVHKRAAATKAYICISVCFCTKAVHIELASDLSTNAFLSALRRFIARRGLPTDLYTDNGKNFEGAANELEEVYRMLQNESQRQQITTDRDCERISWHFSPPKAPHFGGLWEAAVKVAKRQLYRQLGNSKLSFEDLATILAQIEASMNSRPIVPLSEDPNDISALTPAHFLIGSTMHSLPEKDLHHTPTSRLDHYQRMQKVYQQFWHHWRTEYLQELQRDTKTCHPNRCIQPGRLVVLTDELQIPVKWPLARIVAVHPGKDDLVRVVTLRTNRGTITRPVTRICLLPMEGEDILCKKSLEQ